MFCFSPVWFDVLQIDVSGSLQIVSLVIFFLSLRNPLLTLVIEPRVLILANWSFHCLILNLSASIFWNGLLTTLWYLDCSVFLCQFLVVKPHSATAMSLQLVLLLTLTHPLTLMHKFCTPDSLPGVAFHWIQGLNTVAGYLLRSIPYRYICFQSFSLCCMFALST